LIARLRRTWRQAADLRKFMRARELTTQRSLESCFSAEICTGPVWPRIRTLRRHGRGWGRCCWFLDKFTHSSSVIRSWQKAAFQRAFVLDPDLASAHKFYTLLQVDLGRADEAMRRLFETPKASSNRSGVFLQSGSSAPIPRTASRICCSAPPSGPSWIPPLRRAWRIASS